MPQKAAVSSQKSKLENNQVRAEQLPNTPVKGTQAKCNQACLTVTLQSRFVHSSLGPPRIVPEWGQTTWPDGPAVKAAKVELVEPGLTATTDKNGKAILDGSRLSSGIYTLKLTPAPENTWEASNRNSYVTDKARTLRYSPAEFKVEISVNGAVPEVKRVDAPAAAVAVPQGSTSASNPFLPFSIDAISPSPQITLPFAPEISARIQGNDVLVDWRPKWISSPYKTPRPANGSVSMVLIHRTGSATIGSAINTFTGNNVNKTSAHYLVDTDGYVVNLVAETEQAHHAGSSWWSGQKDLNTISIGIEIVNAAGGFTENQYVALIKLLKEIMGRNASITRHRIVAHSDIRVDKKSLMLSSDRGVCPGPDFEWSRLMNEQLSSRPDQSLYAEALIDSAYGSFFKDNAGGKLGFGKSDEKLVRPGTKQPYGIIKELQSDLKAIGYSINAQNGVTETGTFDAATQAAVDRFRRHFMAGIVRMTNNIDPTFDRTTALALKRVVLDRGKP